MVKKALLVGINEYPDKDDVLEACVNDAIDFAELLSKKFKMKYEDIRILTERNATRKNILNRLEWLVKGLKSGDKIVFLYSGHGNRLALRNVKGKVDKYYECICPYDFDWDNEKHNAISDKDFNSIFSKISKGAKLVWIVDSCYSGGLIGIEEFKKKKHSKKKVKGRTIKPTLEALNRTKAAIENKIKLLGMKGAVINNNVVLISATKERQQAQEKSFKKEIKINGLLVYYLLQELNKKKSQKTPLTKVMEKVIRNVRDYAKTSKPVFKQEPQLIGRKELLAKNFL